MSGPRIIAAIRAGKLQYRPAAMQGNPWLRLLRREVEDLVSTRHGERYLLERQARTELKQVNRELKQHRAQLAYHSLAAGVTRTDAAEAMGTGRSARPRRSCPAPAA